MFVMCLTAPHANGNSGNETQRTGDYGVIRLWMHWPVNGFGFAGWRPEAETDSFGNLGSTSSAPLTT